MARIQRTQEPQRVPLWLSLTIEADYRGLGVFPGLRLDQCTKRTGTLLLFNVLPDFAREVLEHAEDRMQELSNGRGVFQAYRAAVAKLRAALDQFDGVQDDPGLEAHQAALSAHGTAYRVGVKVNTIDGEEATIVEGYAPLRRSRCEDGNYRDKAGDRFNYRPGYLATITRDGETRRCVIPPWLVCDAEGFSTHLRLVRSAG